MYHELNVMVASIKYEVRKFFNMYDSICETNGDACKRKLLDITKKHLMRRKIFDECVKNGLNEVTDYWNKQYVSFGEGNELINIFYLKNEDYIRNICNTMNSMLLPIPFQTKLYEALRQNNLDANKIYQHYLNERIRTIDRNMNIFAAASIGLTLFLGWLVYYQ